MDNFKKDKLVSATAKKCGFTKKDVSVVIDALFSAIADALVSGYNVPIQSFGKFVISEVPETNRRNPQNGEIIAIPAHKRVSFKTSPILKEAVK